MSCDRKFGSVVVVPQRKMETQMVNRRWLLLSAYGSEPPPPPAFTPHQSLLHTVLLYDQTVLKANSVPPLFHVPLSG